jgi:uncharacterized protein (TIGR03437 family)
MLQVAGAVAANTVDAHRLRGGIANAASGASDDRAGRVHRDLWGGLRPSYQRGSGVSVPHAAGRDTQVLLGGEPLPLYFTSTGQIDAIVPYDIEPNSMQQVIVQNGLAYSQPQTVAVGTASPGVFTQNQSGSGPGSILGQKVGGNPALNTAANPASARDYLLDLLHRPRHGDASIAAGAAASYYAAVLHRQHGHRDRGRARRARHFRRTGSGVRGPVSGERASCRWALLPGQACQ